MIKNMYDCIHTGSEFADELFRGFVKGAEENESLLDLLLAVVDDWDTFRSLVILVLREDPSFAEELARLGDRIETECLQLGADATPAPPLLPPPTATPQTSPTPGPQTLPATTDREALAALYNATDGANWRLNDNWLSEAPLNDWIGVTTDANGRVTELYFYANQMRGKLPPELGSLLSLEVLYLRDDQLTGEIPPEWGNLASLEVVHLGDNQLSGCVPGNLEGQLDKRFSRLGGLPFCVK